MWMKRSMCKNCWTLWMGTSESSAIGGVFGSDCCICGTRNHDDIFIQADENRVEEIKAEVDFRRLQQNILKNSDEDQNK